MKNFKEKVFDILSERFEQLDKVSQRSYVSRLLREYEMFNRILSILPEGVLLIDVDGNLEFSNESARKLLGLPVNYQGHSLSQYIKEIDLGIIENFKKKKIESSRQELEVFYPEHLFLNVFLYPQFSGEDLEYVVVILENITHFRKEAESSKEQETLQALGMLSAGVAHELGNPLNNIKINLQLCEMQLREGIFEGERFKELIETSLEGVERLDKIIKNFLGALKPVVLSFELVNMVDLMNEVLRFMRTEVESRNIRIITRVAGYIPLINADKIQLHQAFYNIVKNAIQAMEQGKELKIDFSTNKSFLHICFRDSGKGMSLDDLRKIFKPYHSSDSGGTGLGLFIVDKIVRSHGGLININTKVGSGTIFELVFPLVERRLRIDE